MVIPRGMPSSDVGRFDLTNSVKHTLRRVVAEATPMGRDAMRPLITLDFRQKQDKQPSIRGSVNPRD